MQKLKNIIIQAGGRGTRLESLTWNKPKCIVSVHNLPIIFHIFRRFPEADFQIIADYKADVLERYLKIYAKQYHYSIVHADKKGTLSGVKECVSALQEDAPFMLIWSDLIPGDRFELPEDIRNKNYIGISTSFACRWSFLDGQCKQAVSPGNGIAGVFLFRNKAVLGDLPDEGEFVRWLSGQTIPLERFELSDIEEIGTVLAYKKNNEQPVCRPFNEMTFLADFVTKRGINEQGIEIGKKEVNWYRFVSQQDFPNIPKLYSYEPLTMEKIKGRNIFEMDCLVRSQKKIILANIIKSLRKLHELVPAIQANEADLIEAYINKTFARLQSIFSLVPFADREFFRINGRYYRNVFFWKDEVIARVKSFFPDHFCLIHGDCTFSNLMYDTFDNKIVLIDPRGYFGKTLLFGDADYDWGKLYYSLCGNYDQFNQRRFSLNITDSNVELTIKSSDWEDMEDDFFDFLPEVNRSKIKLLHALIWLSLTTYAWDDYDSICGAFYNGILKLAEAME